MKSHRHSHSHSNTHDFGRGHNYSDSYDEGSNDGAPLNRPLSMVTTPPSPPLPNNDIDLTHDKRSTWYAGAPPTTFNSSLPVPARAPSPQPMNDMSPPRSVSPVKRTPSPPKNPFNFESQTFKPGSGSGSASASPKPNQRRGHKYKHSSVSMNFFPEPPKRQPLPLPASLPVPTTKECYQSMDNNQRVRLAWCCCHFLGSIYIYQTDLPFTAVKALAHLVFYDAVGALLCAAVDVLGNFNVWKVNSLHHPFGLERTEVLAGFALAVALIFMGGDIMSHALQDLAQSFYGMHHHHDTPVESFLGLFARVAVALCATVISATGLNNHKRISRTMNQSSISSLPSIFSNPSHLMTVTFSVALLLFPALGPPGYAFIDTLLTPLMAASMCYVGWNISKVLGGMLVMSYSGPDHIEEITQTLKEDPRVSEVKKVSFWQVHYELWLCSMGIVMSGSESDEAEVRQVATDVVRDAMSNKEDGVIATQAAAMNLRGKDAVRWEATIDIRRLTMD